MNVFEHGLNVFKSCNCCCQFDAHNNYELDEGRKKVKEIKSYLFPV